MPFNLKNYQFSIGIHHDKNVIWMKFPNNQTLRTKLKQQFPSAKINKTIGIHGLQHSYATHLKSS
jgi:calcineurin-like phosphoesterase family protein